MSNLKRFLFIFSLLFLNLFSLNAMQRTEQQILEQNAQIVLQNEDLLEIITQKNLEKLKFCRQINKKISEASNNLICSKIISDEINFLKSLNNKYFNTEEYPEYPNVSIDLNNFIDNNYPRYDMQDKQILKTLIKNKQDFLQKYIKYIKFKYQKNFVIKIKNFFWHKNFYNRLNSLLKELFYYQHTYLAYLKKSLIKIQNVVKSCTTFVREHKKFCEILFLAIIPTLAIKLCFPISTLQTDDPNFWLKVALND